MSQLCHYLFMANKAGSSKIKPGAWSLAISENFLARVQEEPDLTRPKLAKLTGISEGRIFDLLKGERAWYVEDVERFCAVFGMDLLKYLKSLSVTSNMVEPQSLRLVAHKQKRKIGTETDEGFFGA